MPLSSFFRSSRPEAPPVAGAKAAPARKMVWRRQELTAYAVSPDEQVVMVHGAVPVRVPGFAVDFVLECGEFRPLEEQVRDYAERHGWGSLELEALRSWMPRLMEAGMLVSAEDVHRRCVEAGSSGEATRLSRIGIPTGGDRVDLVQRAIGSFQKNAEEHGREVEFLVADSSADAAHRDAFRTGLGDGKARVLYAGEEEKRAFVSDLMKAGIEPEALEFALFDPLGTGFICGANRNALLLHEAGRAFACVDDDVMCELSAPENAGSGLKLFSQSDPYVRRLFATREETMAAGKFEAVDFLGAHESLLGRGISDVCEGLDAGELEVSQLKDDLLYRLWNASPKVRATFTGHIGDPGIPTSVYYLYYDGENRRRFTADESRYEAALAGRNLSAQVARPAIGDASLSPGMGMALDHRELLPPFFPVLHAEDFVFGATLWESVPDAVLGHLPLAIRHEPRPGKTIWKLSDFGDDRRVVMFEFAHLIRRLIFGFRGSRGMGAADRMRALGRWLAEIAAQPLPDFMKYLRLQIIEHQSGVFNRMEEQLRAADDIPGWWHRDVEAYLGHVREALTTEDFDIPFDLKGLRTDDENRVLMRKMTGRFGGLLQAWPDIVAAAADRNARGDWMVPLAG